MFDNLVTYHVHKRDPLPTNNALAYQYILASNGIFIRSETRFFEAILPIAPCPVRGLMSLHHQFRLKVPRIPARLLDTILANARRARQPDGLGMTAWPVKYEAGLARDWFHHGHNGYAQAHLMIGCVDNHWGRREIAKTVTAFDGRIWAIRRRWRNLCCFAPYRRKLRLVLGITVQSH